MSKLDPRVDAYLSKTAKWRDEMVRLRSIVLDCGLTEELKWYQPCYTSRGGNVVIISGFKDYCALNFFKGALMKDPNGILVRPGENTQSGRQIRFTSVQQIADMEATLKAYVKDAVEVENAGLKVSPKETSDFAIPDEFQARLNGDPTLRSAFSALTPGRQRAYILYFSAARQSKTRVSRVEKCIERILDGQGLND